ncbi:energy transducer TonB [Vibrio agarivorans]|uniref:energy transducer TonB n=1 Tax=Vibrio agarivorans TaxID=153622 RepID=UPI002232C86D|nr:energy transducer TonB [Vibrio agarivorans]MDN3660148.1 TonB family protein [Vibrio agarivorans]
MGRLILAGPPALLITLSIFMFMSWMVDTSHRKSPEASEGVSFNMVMVENDQDVQRRKRSAPEKPETPEMPEETPMAQADDLVSNLNAMEQPSLNLDTSVSGLAISAPSFGDFSVNQQVMPLYRVEPRYPAQALRRKMEGYVVMKFTIDPTGKPTDIEVVEAEPRRVFEREAIRALNNWKYQPKVENGTAVSQPGQTVKLEFQLEQ